MRIVIGQKAGMEHFTSLYNALYKNGKLGEISVQPIKDNSKTILLSSKKKKIEKENRNKNNFKLFKPNA